MQNFVEILSRLLTSHVVALVAEEALESFFVKRSSSCHVLVLTRAHPKRFPLLYVMPASTAQPVLL